MLDWSGAILRAKLVPLGAEYISEWQPAIERGLAEQQHGGANDNILGLGTSTAKGAYCAAFAASHPSQALVGKPSKPTDSTSMAASCLS